MRPEHSNGRAFNEPLPGKRLCQRARPAKPPGRRHRRMSMIGRRGEVLPQHVVGDGEPLLGLRAKLEVVARVGERLLEELCRCPASALEHLNPCEPAQCLRAPGAAGRSVSRFNEEGPSASGVSSLEMRRTCFEPTTMCACRVL